MLCDPPATQRSGLWGHLPLTSQSPLGGCPGQFPITSRVLMMLEAFCRVYLQTIKPLGWVLNRSADSYSSHLAPCLESSFLAYRTRTQETSTLAAISVNHKLPESAHCIFTGQARDLEWQGLSPLLASKKKAPRILQLQEKELWTTTWAWSGASRDTAALPTPCFGLGRRHTEGPLQQRLNFQPVEKARWRVVLGC